MDELNSWGHLHATDAQRNLLATRIVDQTFGTLRPKFVAAVETFLKQAISPTALHQFELGILLLVRELGRLILQAVIQSLEPRDVTAKPEHLYFQSGGYRRRAKPSANRSIATRFGVISLQRRAYRSWQRNEETIFPLELILGFVENVSPALLDWIGRTIAAAAMSQQATLAALETQRRSFV